MNFRKGDKVMFLLENPEKAEVVSAAGFLVRLDSGQLFSPTVLKLYDEFKYKKMVELNEKRKELIEASDKLWLEMKEVMK